MAAQANNKPRRNGSYAPLSVHYFKDSAVAGLSNKAELLYIRGLAFCADILSDGFISDAQLPRFVGVGITGCAGLARELGAAGLWIRDDDQKGWRVRSWQKYNLSKDEIRSKLKADASRKPGVNP